MNEQVYDITTPIPPVDSLGDSLGDPLADPLDQLDLELARLDQRLQAYWARQQAQGTLSPLAEIPLPHLFNPESMAKGIKGGLPFSEHAARAIIEPPNPRMLHLLQLAHGFHLDDFELDALLVIIAPALDSRYGRIYGYLQDDLTLRHATVDLVLELLGAPGLQRLRHLYHFSEQGALVQHQLIQVEEGNTPLVSRGLLPDPTLVAWFLGYYRPAPQWGDYFQLSWPEADSADAALTADLWPELMAALHGQTFVTIYGDDAIGQQAAVRRLAVEMQLPLLTVEMAGLLAAGTKAAVAVRLALRDASFTGALLHLHDIDGWVQEGVLPASLVEPLLEYNGLIVTTGKSRWQPQGVFREESILWQSFPQPSFSQRRRLWDFFLKRVQPDHTLDINALAGRFRLRGGQIRDVIAGARDQAQRVERTVIEENDLNSAIRAYSQTQLGELTNRIVPRYTWRDLVLPPAQLSILHSVVNMVQRRALVLEEWGVGNKLLPSPAVSVLFAGDPGTGKTMAAEVLAAQLGLDLYKIDLSSMVSKYIGETEKNLEAIFREAEQSNAILFFDEADAVFGKRSGIRDAHDRYANIGVSYLLQRMEAHEGITILATDLRANLDEAFTRRLHFVVDFPFPEASERLRIWRSLIPSTLPITADVRLDQLAIRFKLAGGNIRNIIVSAAFMAAERNSMVTMGLLLEATSREYKKMGRLPTDDESRSVGDENAANGATTVSAPTPPRPSTPPAAPPATPPPSTPPPVPAPPRSAIVRTRTTMIRRTTSR